MNIITAADKLPSRLQYVRVLTSGFAVLMEIDDTDPNSLSAEKNGRVLHDEAAS